MFSLNNNKIIISCFFFILAIFSSISSESFAQNQVKIESEKNIEKTISNDHEENIHFSHKVLKVGLIEWKPFVFKKKGETKWTGIIVELWEEIAKISNIEFEYIPTPSFNKTVTGTANGNYDIGIGSISVTPEREKIIDYTNPVFIDRLAIGMKNKKADFLKSSLKRMAYILFIIGVFGGVVMFIASAALWYFERKKSEEMEGVNGFGLSLWVTFACFLRDLLYSPKSIISRLIICFWLIFSTAFMIILTSTTTSILTHSLTLGSLDFKKSGDLAGKSLTVEDGTTYVELARRFTNKVKPMKSNDLAVKHIEKGLADGVLSTHTTLYYHLKENPSSPIKISSFYPKLDSYAFVIPRKSYALQEAVNQAILKIQKSKFALKTCIKYLGEDSSFGCDL